jgi:hypothetical protein
VVRRLKGRGGEEEPSPTSVHNRLTPQTSKFAKSANMTKKLFLFTDSKSASNSAFFDTHIEII